MASSNITEPSHVDNSVPPPWYTVHKDRGNQLYIPLPLGPSKSAIFLTALKSSDAPAMQRILDIPSLNDALISLPKPYTLADANFWINLQLSGPGTPWFQALRSEDPETGIFIGSVSLTPAAKSSYALLEADGGECGSTEEYVLGYYLHPEFRKRGIMRNAVLALLAWAFTEQGVKRVRIDVVVNNVSSRRLVESLDGFVREEGEKEMVWPESKGGGMKTVLTWRWRYT